MADDKDQHPPPAAGRPHPPAGENGEQTPILPNDRHGGREGFSGTCGDPGIHAGDENAMRYDADAPPGAGMPTPEERQQRPDKPDTVKRMHGT